MLNLPPEVSHFLDIFQKKGYQVYIVGGAIRDLLLFGKTDNWDFATSATPEEILKILPDGFYNNQFGTVGIEMSLNDKKTVFEITTFRKEEQYEDLRHPKKIEWAKTIEEDLGRRDFTINTIAYDGKKIIDLFDGQKHIKDKSIVAVGDPNIRFHEDALRLLRAIRIACELGFLIEEKTRQAIQKNAALIQHISWERIRDELFKVLKSKNAADGVTFLKNTGLLTFVLPELDICFIIPQKSPKRHHVFDVGTHSIMSLKHCPSEDVITRLATLLHDIGKATTFKRDEKSGIITFHNHEVVSTKLAAKIGERLKLSKKQKEKLTTLIKNHQFTVSELQTDKAVRRFIRNVGKDHLQDMLDLRTGDRLGSGAKPTSWRLELFKKRLEEVQKEPFKVTDLKINGEDVMKTLNIKPSPEVGKVLQNIFNDVTEGKIKNEREELLQKITEYK